MVLVTLAALFLALLFLFFKVFELRGVPLLPAIVINYFTAFLCGLAVSRPWAAGDLSPLWGPSLGLGALFITVFHFMAVSAQRAGIAATAVSSKMSLVLTVLFGIAVLGERQGPLGWSGIVLALVGVVLSSWRPGGRGGSGAWSLPLLLFIGNAAIDIGILYTQRTRTTPLTGAVLPTLAFGAAAVLGLARVLAKEGRRAFTGVRTWAGGLLLGAFNYASLYFVVRALAGSDLPSSSVFPLMNIGVVLFGALGGALLFRERPRPVQLIGIGLSVAAMALVLIA